MSARTDLDNAISILDAGITAHVAALKTARDTAAAAQALANDESHLQDLTVKVLAMADVLNASNEPVVPVVAPAAPVAPVVPEVPVVAPVAPPLPAVPPSASIVVPPDAVVAPAEPQHPQTLMEMMNAVAARAGL